MLRYLINYFVARTTYDAVYRASARGAQRRAISNYQRALANVELEARRNYVPLIDDNMVNAGRHHAELGSSEEVVERSYGPRLSEHERKNLQGAGVNGVAYRIGYFDVGVELEKGRSVRECWVKNTRAPTEVITAGEMTAIMNNKAYGPGWERLENSSETRLWYRSETGLVACCDWDSPIAGGSALTIFDPEAGTPEGLPPLPPSRAALPPPRLQKKTNGCVVALCVVLGLVIFPSLIHIVTQPQSSSSPQRHAPTVDDLRSDVIPAPSATVIAGTDAAKPTASVGISQPKPVASTAPPAERATSVSSERKVLYSPQPTYPFAAQKRQLRGTGRFRIRFARDGRATAVEVVRSMGNSILDEAATSALSKWRAQPAGSDLVVVVPITLAPPER